MFCEFCENFICVIHIFTHSQMTTVQIPELFFAKSHFQAIRKNFLHENLPLYTVQCTLLFLF